MSFDLRLDNGKLLLDESGNAEIITGTDKLIQDILRELTTPLGGDIFDRSRGSIITRDLVGSPVDPEVLIPSLEAGIIRCLDSFKSRQEILAQKQFLSDAEMLARIDNVTVEMDSVDPRQYNVVIDISSRDLTPLVVTFTFQLF